MAWEYEIEVQDGVILTVVEQDETIGTWKVLALPDVGDMVMLGEFGEEGEAENYAEAVIVGLEAFAKRIRLERGEA